MEEATSTLATAIGTRIRGARQARGWTLDHLADAAGVSRRMIVNVEQGSVNPSVGTLLHLSDALGIGLPALVGSLDSPAHPAVQVTRHGSGSALWTSPGGGRGVLVAGTAAPDVLELWDWTLAAGDRNTSEAHTTGTREVLQVREGTLEVHVGDRHHTLVVDDAMTFPGDVPHTYANPTDTPARFTLAVFEPGVGTTTGETP